MTTTSRLFYVFGATNSADDAIDDIPFTGVTPFMGTPGTLGADTSGVAGVLNGLAIAPAEGVYFVTSLSGNNSNIYEEKFGQTPTFTTASEVGGAPVATAPMGVDAVTSLALNASDDILYFVSGTSFDQEKFSGANFSGTVTKTQLAVLPGSASTSSQQLAFDQDDHAAYFAAPAFSAGFGSSGTPIDSVTKNLIYKVSDVTSTAGLNSLNSHETTLDLGGVSDDNLPFADGVITGVAWDGKAGAKGTLFITTKAIVGTAANHAGIYAYDDDTGKVSTVWDEKVTSATQALNDMTYITVDPATGDYFVSDGDHASQPGIYTGSIGSSATPVELYADSTSTDSGAFTEGLAIDTPATVTAGASATFDGGQTSATTLDSGLTIADIDNSELVSATVTIASGHITSDTLAFTNQNNITSSYNASTGVLSLTGVDSVAHYQTALDSITYSLSPSNGDPTNGGGDTSRTIDWTVDDGVANSAVATSTLTVVHEPPTATAGATATFDGGQSSPTTLDAGLTVSDPDSGGLLKGAKVTISGGITGDTLTFTNQNGITAVYNPSTKVLSLTGSASVTNYQTALESVTYSFSPANGDPTNGGADTSRTIDWTVDDGVVNSTAVTSTLDVVHEPPTVAAGATVTFDGGQSSASTLDAGLSVSDPDSGGLLKSAKVTIASGISGDTLTFTNQNGINGSYNLSTKVLSLTGSATFAQYQTALESVGYDFTPAYGDPTSGGADTIRTIDWTVDDGVANSTVATSTLDVVHEPPVLNASGTVNYSEIGAPVALDATASVSDPDSGDLLQSATVDISTGFLAGDVLSASTIGVPSITATYNGNGLLTLTGSDTLADYQAVLQSVTYASTASDATNGGTDNSRTITWSVNDGAASNATTETSMVNITPCYCRGARILTDRGEVAVEELRVGDLAVTASGQRRPIVWIGHRRLDLSRHPDPVAVCPVRISANAFGEGLPRRNLWLSPGHNVASEGALMPISSLINGRSVAQIERDRVEYWHVELEAHDILLAEGLPAESYLDCGNRAAFANGGAFIEAHPDFAPKYWADTCLPLVKQGPLITAAKARLIARLVDEGHRVVQEANPHIVVDGRRIEPFRASEMQLAFTLPPGGREIALRSNVFVPAHTIAESVDSRELGICVAQLRIDGETVALDCDEACTVGWREAEFVHGIFARRWTSGAALLPAGARNVIVDLAGIGYYWLAPPERLAALSA